MYSVDVPDSYMDIPYMSLRERTDMRKECVETSKFTEVAALQARADFEQLFVEYSGQLKSNRSGEWWQWIKCWELSWCSTGINFSQSSLITMGHRLENGQPLSEITISFEIEAPASRDERVSSSQPCRISGTDDSNRRLYG